MDVYICNIVFILNYGVCFNYLDRLFLISMGINCEREFLFYKFYIWLIILLKYFVECEYVLLFLLCNIKNERY